MGDANRLPLCGLKVVDLGFGQAAALAAKFLADCGADVTRFEPARGDPFYAVYPAYAAWRAALARVVPYDRTRLARAIEDADILLYGGEALVGVEPVELPQKIDNGRLIRVRIRPCLVEEGLPIVPSADLLIQAATGMMHEAGSPDPVLAGHSISGVGGCLQALIAIGAALCARERHGQIASVEVGLVESALSTFATVWSWADDEPSWFAFNIPRDAAPIVAQCRDGRFVHVVLGAAGSKYRLYRLLGIDVDLDPADAGLPSASLPGTQFFGDVPLLSKYIAEWKSDELLAALASEKIVAGPVLGVSEAWSVPQLMHNGLLREYAGGFRQPGCLISFTPAPAAVPEQDVSAKARAPLSDVCVANFGAFVAGPMASVDLTDLGARVFKVENAGGDPLRGSAQFFAAANRGQRSVTLDLKDEHGRAMARHLIDTADVVCSNFKVGVAERLGIDAATLIARDPRKIVLFNSGFGSTGPMAELPAFDPMMQALCGLEHRSGGRSNPPALTRCMPVDTVGGILGQIGVLFALAYRARTGRGMAIEVPLLHAPWLILADIVRDSEGNVLGPEELMSDRRGYTANEHVYRSQDGWVALAARAQQEKAALARMFELPDTDTWDESIVMLIARQTSTIPTAELVARLTEQGIPAVAPLDVRGRSIIDCERRRAMGLMYLADRPGLRNVRGFARGFTMTGFDLSATGHVPILGEANVMMTPMQLAALPF